MKRSVQNGKGYIISNGGEIVLSGGEGSLCLKKTENGKPASSKQVPEITDVRAGKFKKIGQHKAWTCSIALTFAPTTLRTFTKDSVLIQLAYPTDHTP